MISNCLPLLNYPFKCLNFVSKMSIKEIPPCIVYRVFNLITYDLILQFYRGKITFVKFTKNYVPLYTYRYHQCLQIPIFTTILRRYSKGTI